MDDRTQVRLGSAPSAAAEARTAVRGALAGLPEDVVEVACLLADELVANAVLHAGAALHMTIDRSATTVTVGVADGSHTRPERRRHGPEGLSGRGLHLLDQMASEWGTTGAPVGKTVWFRLDLGDTTPTGDA